MQRDTRRFYIGTYRFIVGLTENHNIADLLSGGNGQSSLSWLPLALNRKNKSTSTHMITRAHSIGSRMTLCIHVLSQLSIDLLLTSGDVMFG